MSTFRILCLGLILPAALFVKGGQHVLALIALLLQALGVAGILIYGLAFVGLSSAWLLIAWFLAAILAIGYRRILTPALNATTQDGDGTFKIEARAAAEFYKELYEELYSTERHIGTLRTRVAWGPGTITAGIFGLFLKANDPKSVNQSFSQGLSWMVGVLILAFFADCYLVYRQKLAAEMCKRCEYLWLDTRSKECQSERVPVARFGNIKTTAKPKVIGKWLPFGDFANLMLLAYFAALILMMGFLSGSLPKVFSD